MINTYTLDDCLLIRGESDKKIHSLILCWNTFMMYFWNDYFGGGWWTQTGFIEDDIKATSKLLLEQANMPDDSITIEMFSFIENLKPCPVFKKTYRNSTSYYHSDCDLFATPRECFHEIMRLLKYESIEEAYKKECREEGIPPIFINVVS